MTKTARAPTLVRSPTKRPTKPGRARTRTTDLPPPESAALRDRAGPYAPSFEAPYERDEVVEEMGEDAVRAITSGEDESEADRGDGDRERILNKRIDDGSLFDDPPDEDTPTDEDEDEEER